MSDPITVTDGMVEKAAQALHDRRSMECQALHEVGQPLRNTVYDNERRAEARAALEAVADDLRAEGAAEAWDEAVDEAHGCGWVHYQARQDLRARNPYRADASTALGVKS